jgi:hypothetical protein
MTGGHRGIKTRLQISQLAQLTDHPLADLRDDGGNVGITGSRELDKLWLEALSRAIEIDPLEENN